MVSVMISADWGVVEVPLRGAWGPPRSGGARASSPQPPVPRLASEAKPGGGADRRWPPQWPEARPRAGSLLGA